MSLVIALEGAGGIVLAAESRVTHGYTLQGPRTRDDSVKIVQLNDGWGVMTYGLSEIGYDGITSLKDEISRAPEEFESLEPLLARSTEAFRSASREWETQNPQVQRRARDVGFIIGGCDRRGTASGVFNFQSPEFIPKGISNGCLLAGQWHVARFFSRYLYSRNLSVRQLSRLAVFLLVETMRVDRQVGGAIRLATATRSGGFSWAGEEDIEVLARENDAFRNLLQRELLSALRNTLYSGGKSDHAGEQ